MPTSQSPQPDRPSNHEVENENQRPAGNGDGDGKAPRPATEPRGAKTPDSPKTRTDPGSGEA